MEKTVESQDHKNTKTLEHKSTRTQEQKKIKQLKTKKWKPPKFFLPVIGFVLVLILLWLGGQVYERSKKPSDASIKFAPKKVIVQVGKETLYGQDLNYELSIYFPQTSKSQEPVPEEIKQKALDQIIEKSLLLCFSFCL